MTTRAGNPETLAPPVGRNTSELVRQIQAFQHVQASREVCYSGWQPVKPTLKSSPELVGKVYQALKPLEA